MSPLRPTDPSERMDIGVLLLAVTTTAMMLQATRVFFSYMVFIIDQAERVQLGVTAGAVYLGIGVGALVPRLLGIRRSALILTGAMALARLALQLLDLPEARMWLGAATILLSGWLLPVLMTMARSAAAYGIGLGLALDIAIRISRNTIDLPLMPSAGAHAGTFALLLATLAGIFLIEKSEEGSSPSGAAFGALALGPALALHHLAIGNLGMVELRLERGIVTGALVITSGFLLGLGTYPLLSRIGVNRINAGVTTVTLIALGAMGLWLFWEDVDGVSEMSLVIATAATTALIVTALGSNAGRGGVVSTALWLMLGLLIHAIVLFAYFTATGLPILIVVVYAVIAVVAASVSFRPMSFRLRAPAAAGGFGAVGLALLLAVAIAAARAPETVESTPLPSTFTVMTYNIQAGFSRDNYWDLEQTARMIEAAGPEVVVLQEVGRGWPILSAADQAAWLADRLGMQLVWGPASQDDLWGNAILTNAPIISSEWVKYETTENLRRGAVKADLETEAGPVTVIVTHLDDPGSATGARQQQIAQLLEFWDGADPGLIAGDLNTVPESEALDTFERAAFIDTGQDFSQAITTSDDGRRIDYVLVTPNLQVVEAAVPDTWASDHKPVVVTLSMP